MELFDWAVPLLPCYAAPSYLEFREQLPKNQVGRILKYQLREDAVTPHTWAAPRHGGEASSARTADR